jgi:hypothetical protein
MPVCLVCTVRICDSPGWERQTHAFLRMVAAGCGPKGMLLLRGPAAPRDRSPSFSTAPVSLRRVFFAPTLGSARRAPCRHSSSQTRASWHPTP